MIGIFSGASHKKGAFTNEDTGEVIEYDNLCLTLLVPIRTGGQYDPIEAIGTAPEKRAQCPFVDFPDVFGGKYKSLAELQPLIGREVE